MVGPVLGKMTVCQKHRFDNPEHTQLTAAHLRVVKQCMKPSDLEKIVQLK